MADIQNKFKDFHTEILLSDDDGKAKLQEKRDLLVKNLIDGLKRDADKNNEDPLKFEYFNQGGNAMHIGNKPLNNDYDIDVGIIFNNTQVNFNSTIELKTKVKNALNSNFRTVNIRRPCITITYMKENKPDYHVDLAIYVKVNNKDHYEIAMGKEHSSEDNQIWQASDPKELINKINTKFTGDERNQFKRVIRYLKRWRDKQFTNGGAPISIALTCAAYHWFSPVKIAGVENDLRALRALVNKIILNFSLKDDRLIVNLPVIPNNDLFSEMTNNQMTTFKEKFNVLQDSLISARDDISLRNACKTLRKQFGGEFPISEDDNKPGDKIKKGTKSPVVTTGTNA